MSQYLSAIALLIPDYDEAIEYFTRVLGFALIEDSPRGGTKRWVVVAPPGAKEARILLAKAVGEEQLRAIGNQSGGRVMFFLTTDDFETDFIRMKSNGVTFLEEPRHEPYGRVVVFCDKYGNKWDLIQPVAD